MAPCHLRPRQHHQRTGTPRGRGSAGRLSGAARTGDAAWRLAPPDPHRRSAHRSAPPPRATHHRVVGAGRWGRRARRLDRRHNPGRTIPAHSRPTARDPAATAHTRHTAAQSRPHRHGGRQWPEPVALTCEGGRCRAERRSPPTVPELRLGFGTSGRSRPHVCAGPADEAHRQDPHLPMRERVGTLAA